MKTIALISLLLFQFNTFAGENLNYFPADYEASKSRFVSYQGQLSQKYLGVQKISINVGTESLTVDTFHIPAQKTPRKLLILTSGNHGPEGYTGSALQALFIEEVLPKLDLSETGILFVHALNPWGFKHHRRGTENNVNLNRNFALSDEHFQLENPGYDQLRKILEPSYAVRKTEIFPAFKLLWNMMTKKDVTKDSLTQAIGMGQYTSSKGINFGGNSFEPQTLAMIELLKSVCEPYSEIFDIDLHTGLGKKNTLHIMTKDGMTEDSKALMHQVFVTKTDGNNYEITPPDREGFYDIHGDYVNIIGALYPTKKIVPVTAEFGTIGNGLVAKTRTANRLILENQGFYYGYDHETSRQRIERQYLELFYPSSSAWKTQALQKGRYLLDTVVNRFINASL